VSADILVEVGHLSDSTSVVGDGAIAVNGEGNGEATEHTDGSKSDTVHAGEVVRAKDGDRKAEDGHDGREVAKGKAVDDLRGGTMDARLSELVGRGAFGGASVVLSDKTDEETGPEAKDNACICLPRSGVVGLSSKLDQEVIGEGVNGGDDHSGHEEGGNPELDLEGQVGVEDCFCTGSNFLLSRDLDVSEELADEGGNDSNGSDGEGEVDSIGVMVMFFELAETTRAAQVASAREPKRSAPIPAMSPTLSPTLSAIVPGLRGESSGRSSQTLPARSAPTSAALV